MNKQNLLLERIELLLLLFCVLTTLLYFISDPEDPVAVWRKLVDQFEN